MDEPRAGFAQAGAFAVGQVDRVAEERARADQPVRLVDVEIVARLRIERADPGDFLELFAQMRLHQAIGVFGPESAHRVELFGGRGRGKARRDRIGQPVAPVPAPDQRAAVVIGRLRRVAQRVGGVAVHRRLARRDAHAARLGGGEQRVDAGGVDRAKAAQAGRAMGQHEVEAGVGDGLGMGRVAKARFLGEGVAVEPVDQPLAPGGDDRGLRVMHMRVDEPGRDQAAAVIVHARLGVGGAQGRAVAHRQDAPVFDQHAAMGVVARGLGTLGKRICGKGQGLAEKKVAHRGGACRVRGFPAPHFALNPGGRNGRSDIRPARRDR